MASIVLRAFEHTDIAAALELWAQAPGVGLGLSDTPAELSAFLERNAGLSWVATQQSTVVGAVLAGHDGRRGTLYHLAVAASHRRQHIGRNLVEACLSSLRQAGIPRVTIHVFSRNQAAIDFWHSIGWYDRPDLSVVQFQFTPPPSS